MNRLRILLCLLGVAACVPGCKLTFIDRGQRAPLFKSDIVDSELHDILTERLGSLHTLKCHGVDMTVKSPKESFSADLALFIDPPSRARAIATKGILGTMADIVAEGNLVRVYSPFEKKLYMIHVRAADFRSLRTMPWSLVWGMDIEGQSPAVSPDTALRKAEDHLILDVPLPLGVGNTERIVFDRKTLLPRSRTIRREGQPPAARIEYNRWRLIDSVWWPLHTRLRMARLDTEITLVFRAKKMKLNGPVAPEVFTLDMPKDTEVVHESVR